MGLGLEVLSSEQSRIADSKTIAGGIKSENLMESAGSCVVEEILSHFKKCKTLILAGPGNNGGDGFVIARLLQENGWDVEVALVCDRKKLKGDAALMAEKYEGKINGFSAETLQDCGLVVDALFGTGLTKPIKGEIAEIIKSVTARKLPVVSVDMPSGINSDNGKVMGIALRANLTVTFQRKKIGHLLLPGREYCGEVIVRDIGISEKEIEKLGCNLFENQPELWLEKFPRHKSSQHKYSHGHALVVGGGASTTGAARLSAASALATLRTGAGLVTLVCDTESLLVYAKTLTAVMTKTADDLNQFEEILADEKKNTLLIGPGCGVNEATKEMALCALKAGKNCVLDADALTVFQHNPEELFAAISSCKGQVVLTPHEGEFKRLFEFADNKLISTRNAAEESGAVVLFKGADTVIAAPDGKAAINTNAPPTLATAGSGDVLAGIILGLITAGMDGFSAACAGAWIHGEAARGFGTGLISEDLPNLIPDVLKKLERYSS